MNSLFSSWSAALKTLTILPCPGKTAGEGILRISLIFFPFVGIVIALLLWGTYVVFKELAGLPPLPLAVIVVALSTIITGALHIDGLADVCDGFGGGATRERILEIFKDPRHGTFGVTAIVLVLLAKVVFYAALFSENALYVVALSIVLSRIFQAITLALMPYAGARQGTAAAFATKEKRLLILGCLFVPLAACSALFWPFGAIAAGASGLVCAIFCLVSLKKINGITGDCIGCVNELVELTVIVTGLILTGIARLG